MPNNMLTKQRGRQWILTIHESAPAFADIALAVRSIEVGFYAYILHDKDIDLKSGEITPSHYHLVLEFENARSFVSVQKLFPGAHIEKINSFIASINYLIHNTESSSSKSQYERTEIFSNDDLRVETILDSDMKRIFDKDMILGYFNEGILSITDFYRVFGAQIQRYIFLIDRLRPDFEMGKSFEKSTLPENDDFD